MSPKKTGNNSPPCYSCTFFEFSRPRAAARGTALRAVKVLTSRQTLPEPLTATHGNTRQHIAACHLQMRIHASTHTHARIETNTETETEIDTDADTDTDTDANIDIDTRHRTQTDKETETEKQAKTDMQTDRQTYMYPQARAHIHKHRHMHTRCQTLFLSLSRSDLPFLKSKNMELVTFIVRFNTHRQNCWPACSNAQAFEPAVLDLCLEIAATVRLVR